MSRQVRQFCLRDSLPTAVDVLPDIVPLTHIDQDATGNSMTWQQKKNFGPAIPLELVTSLTLDDFTCFPNLPATPTSIPSRNLLKSDTTQKKHEKSKGVHWTNLDLEAIEAPSTTSIVGEGRSWTEQKEDFPTASKRQLHRPRDTVKDSNPDNTTTTNNNTPAQRTITSLDSPHNPHKKARKRSNRSRNKKTKGNEEMDALPKSAYVPPHLRKRAEHPPLHRPISAGSVPPHLRKRTAAPVVATKSETDHAPEAANGASTASLKSGTTNTEKYQSTPNRASNDAHNTPSTLTSDQEEPHQPVKVECVAEDTVVSPPSVKASGDAGYVVLKDLAWDTPKPCIAPVAPKKENLRWPRTRGPRKTVWPKASEMRARSSESSVDGGVVCKSDSNGDPDYDVKKLMDWNGDWMPAPESWAGRKGHVNKHLGKSVEEWINTHPNEIFGDHVKYEKSPTFSDDKEIVPRFWVANKIEQGSLGEFWKSMPTREPRPLSDTSESPPFWERYEENGVDFIETLEVPAAQVDPGDLCNHHPHRDLLVSADEAIKARKDMHERNAKRTQRKQNRPIPMAVPTGPPPPDRRIVPKANVYFRPFQPRDVEGIAAIYNHYIEETIYANEFDVRTAEQISNRISGIVEEGLPYLVAIAKGNHCRGPNNYVQEKVVGFASLEDYCDRSSMYRYTFELQLFVHPGYTSQNIASCLLDALLEMSNTGYNACGGYEYRNDFEYLKLGPKRVIKTITLTVCKESGESAEAATDFLKRFKFSRVGHIVRAGYKLGKVVDVHLYQHTTSESVDPNSRPEVPL